MIYALDMGASEKTILDQARAQKGPIPKRILEAPELELGLDWTYQAFCKLTTCRAIGMGAPGPIPWTAVNDYCIANGVTEEDQEDLEYLIEKMDDAYIKHASEKAKAEQAVNRPPRKPLKANSRRR